jgi:DNA-directed RNA polymerase subunit RPC12/RpoP
MNLADIEKMIAPDPMYGKIRCPKCNELWRMEQTIAAKDKAGKVIDCQCPDCGRKLLFDPKYFD